MWTRGTRTGGLVDCLGSFLLVTCVMDDLLAAADCGGWSLAMWRLKAGLDGNICLQVQNSFNGGG